MKITIPGNGTIAGSPETIVKLMQAARYIDAPTGDDYIATICSDADRLLGANLHVTGDTYPQRCESLLREMNRTHMIRIEEE